MAILSILKQQLEELISRKDTLIQNALEHFKILHFPESRIEYGDITRDEIMQAIADIIISLDDRA